MRQRKEAAGTLIDISVPLAAHLPSWPGDTPFSCGWRWRREDDASVNLGVLTTSAHNGTHADAPLHVESDWPASEFLPASVFVGPALVIELAADHPVTDNITVPILQSHLGERLVDRVLVRTGCSIASGQFPEDWPTLDLAAAEWLVQRGVHLFGTDAPSVDRRMSTALPVHHALFDGGGFILENLALGAVTAGTYELLAQPLAIHGADAAPVRAMLRLP
jgi:arylformamidase